MIALLFVAHIGLGLALRDAPLRTAQRGAWAWLVVSTAAALLVVEDLAPGARFLVLCISTFLAFKPVCHAGARRRGAAPLRPLAWLAYALLWVGMSPAPFVALGGPALPGSARRLLAGLAGTLAGIAAWVLLACAFRAGAPAALVGALQLVGAFLLLRLGVFPAGAGVLGLLGVAVGPVFRAPERARSLTEFWSQRWNRPFSELLQLAVDRPLRARWGRGAARAASFLLSGALHEVALSVPVRAGYGLPTSYFLLQAALAQLEGRWRARGGGPERWGVAGRVWTLAWAALPAVLVFHPPFVRGVLLPLLGPVG